MGDPNQHIIVVEFTAKLAISIPRQRFPARRVVKCRLGVQDNNVERDKVGGCPNSPESYPDERNSGDIGSYCARGSNCYRATNRRAYTGTYTSRSNSEFRSALQGFPVSLPKALELIACGVLAVDFKADDSNRHDFATFE